MTNTFPRFTPDTANEAELRAALRRDYLAEQDRVQQAMFRRLFAEHAAARRQQVEDLRASVRAAVAKAREPSLRDTLNRYRAEFEAAERARHLADRIPRGPLFHRVTEKESA